MPSEKDVEEWGMQKDRYIEVCRAMVASGAMCYEGREGDDLRDEDFFCEVAGDGSIIPFAGVVFKRPADASVDGRGAVAEEQQFEEYENSEVASQESLKSKASCNKKEGKGKNPQQYLSFPSGDVHKPLSQAAAEMLMVDKRAEACYRCITANNLPQKYASKPPEMWLKWYRILEDEYADRLSQALGLQQPAPEKRRTAVYAASTGALSEASSAHLACEEEELEEGTPRESPIQLQAAGTESVLGAMTPVTTVAREQINQLQLDQAWEELRQYQGDLERRDLVLTERRTVVAREEYNIRNKEAEVRKLENAVEQNRMIMKRDWDQREDAWKDELA